MKLFTIDEKVIKNMRFDILQQKQNKVEEENYAVQKNFNERNITDKIPNALIIVYNSNDNK